VVDAGVEDVTVAVADGVRGAAVAVPERVIGVRVGGGGVWVSCDVGDGDCADTVA
jgi:hypothetical protein